MLVTTVEYFTEDRVELIFPPLSNISEHKRATVPFKYNEVPPSSGRNCALPSFSDAKLPALLFWEITFFFAMGGAAYNATSI